MELVLTNMNKLNRTLEGVITIGHEFASVEALWSTFENVMAKDVDNPQESVASRKPDEKQSNDGPSNDETDKVDLVTK
ncbi:hypothetical protein GcM3_048011 [Golovinomyces cichoracearum]|uniref:DASH complex subunit DAD1 n=1 Tax=Golovinomyces cichoracearum TaxID=62708 RepID=A0A420J088_9PEZI|nr:hypothetical protein GcM3_048011 [Golovinomyces cichoracearum]